MNADEWIDVTQLEASVFNSDDEHSAFSPSAQEVSQTRSWMSDSVVPPPVQEVLSSEFQPVSGLWSWNFSICCRSRHSNLVCSNCGTTALAPCAAGPIRSNGLRRIVFQYPGTVRDCWFLHAGIT